ncbi:MAG: site-specific integrase [Chitinophagales bacterium]|nr:site-specific integrase [Chitinophagales bacterium]
MATNSFTLKFVVKTEKQDNFGLVPIYAKMYINGQKLELSTNKRIESFKWDKYNKNAKFDNDLNEFLELFKTKMYNTYSKALLNDEYLTPELFKTMLKGVKKPTQIVHYLIETATLHNTNFEKMIGIKYSYGSYKNYKSTLKYLKEFVPIYSGNKDIPLEEVNYNFCEAYYGYVTTEKTCTTNGANKQIQRLKKIINYAIKQGFISKNPMATFTLEFKQVNRVILTIEELKKLIQFDFQRPTLEKVRDVFIFQCFTGLSYADIKTLNLRDIEDNLIKMDRAKTGNKFVVPLLPQALELIDKYADYENATKPIFPVLSNQKMNLNLKLIQEIVGIKKSLTTHIGRHTFATTIALANGVPIETVSKMLGHTKISTTQVYAKVLDDKIIKDMDKLKDRF